MLRKTAISLSFLSRSAAYSTSSTPGSFLIASAVSAVLAGSRVSIESESCSGFSSRRLSKVILVFMSFWSCSQA
ncbi:hypothetical protein D3C72_2465370 [compost metagenome]